MTDNLARLLSKVTRGCCEASLQELFVILDLPESESTLSKVQIVSVELNKMGLKIIPHINQGEVGSTRRITFAEDEAPSAETVLLEITNRESDNFELKSSLLFDHGRFQVQPEAPLATLKSEEVLHSSLKTVSAFLNSAGGVLIVGVDDAATVLGINHDFVCMTDRADRRNADGWELILRSFIGGRFKDGNAINDYVQCVIVELDAKLIARINVSPRKQLSFLKHKNDFQLYRRQGNQTIQVGIDQVEEFLELRRSLFD